MCLYCNTDNSKVAAEDIICWKIIARNKRTHATYTPYHFLYVTRDQREGKEDFVPEQLGGCPTCPSDGIVNEGFIHVHFVKNVAIDKFYILNMISVIDDVEFLLYECVIPKGTAYYEGTDGENTYAKAAAAERIRFVRQINPSNEEKWAAHRYVVARIQEAGMIDQSE